METRIVGGTKANPKRFPYFTLVKVYTVFEPKGWFCGGSLIARDVVLTSAYCLVPDYSRDNVTAVDVWVNSTTTAFSEYEHYSTSKELVVYPQYELNSPLHDIGLIFLDEAVTGVPLVKMNRDASVPRSVNPPLLTTIGLGATGYNETSGSFTYPKVLMQASIKPVPEISCRKVYGSTMVGKANLCASGGGVRGVCNHDYGGPLIMMKSAAKNDVQIGITTRTYQCPTEADYPDIFTRVSFYAPWVDAQICKYSSFYKPSKCPTLGKIHRAIPCRASARAQTIRR